MYVVGLSLVTPTGQLYPKHFPPQLSLHLTPSTYNHLRSTLPHAISHQMKIHCQVYSHV